MADTKTACSSYQCDMITTFKEEEGSSWTIRGSLVRMDSYVTDSPDAARRGLELPSSQNAAPAEVAPQAGPCTDHATPREGGRRHDNQTVA